jgi:hypothetical protein
MKHCLLCLSIISFLPAIATGEDDPNWERIQLDARFRSEGSAAADINNDGRMDVVAGDVWYAAPDWTVHEIRVPGEFVAGVGYSNSFVNWTYDINDDGWMDVIIGGFPGAPFHWYENPKGEKRHWTEHQIWTSFCNETPQFRDVTGDGRPDVVIGSQPEAQMGFLEIPTGDAVYEPWAFHAISTPGDPNVNGTFMYYHGLGVTDVNADGNNDVVIPHGWWKNPGNASQVTEPWEFFEHRLSSAPDQPPLTGADIYAVDLDVDGDNDLVMSCAHAYGVWWFENIGDDDHSEFVYHLIDESYSQTHAMWFADINEDGQADMITGKRYFAHNGGDPGAYDPVVMYWYELHPKEGGPEIIPHQIVAGLDTGVGTQFTMADMNGDDHIDIVLSNKKGVNILLQRPASEAAN